MSIITETSLGDLARQQPSATRVFLRHHLDFCCRGRTSLADACADAGLDVALIVDELAREEARGAGAAPWTDRPLAELADHIEARYHASLREDLPSLIAAARKVERVHAQKPGVPAGLADVLAEMYAEMEAHMQKEERVLFPMIRAGARGPAIRMPIAVMEAEHVEHGTRLAKIRELTAGLVLPAHACATWTALYRNLELLEAELMEHIHLENHVLFERALQG